MSASTFTPEILGEIKKRLNRVLVSPSSSPEDRQICKGILRAIKGTGRLTLEQFYFLEMDLFPRYLETGIFGNKYRKTAHI